MGFYQMTGNFHTISYPAICFPKLISFIEVNCSNTVWCLLGSYGWMGNGLEGKKLADKNWTIESLNAIKQKN